MYSVVLMMAVTTGGEAADFGRRGGCRGGCYGGCYGGGYGGGCYGGGYGGCYGGMSSGGCYGGGYGGMSSGGCYGGMSYGGMSYGGGYGCYGGGYAVPVTPGTTTPGTTTPETGRPEKERERETERERSRERERERETEKSKEKQKDKSGDTSRLSAPANLYVTLPADATLTIDDQVTTSTSSSRAFITPALQVRAKYQYTLKAQVVRDGRTLTATERVFLRGGESTSVSLPLSKFTSSSVAAR